MDGAARKAWLNEVFDWLKSIEGDFDLIMIRNGSLLTKADVLQDTTNGLVITEHMIWFFADHKDAIKFKLRWVDE